MAITATVAQITVNEQNIEGKKKRNRCTIQLSSADTYPSAGIPLATFGQFGMVRQLDYVILLEAIPSLSSDTFVWTYSASDGNQGTLRAFGTATAGTAAVELVEVATTISLDADTKFLVEAVGW
jgi:hypothetical protein